MTIDVNISWKDFNNAEDGQSYELIPDKTLAKVIMKIKRGEYITKEWADGYATKSKSSPAVYLACEFIILGGKYDKRKVWSNIGLYSENSPIYSEIGRKTIKAILNSANNLKPEDISAKAQSKRIIKDFGDLDNLIFVAEISVNDKGQSPKNEIKTIITPDHSDYMKIWDDSLSFHDDEIPF